MVEKLLEGGKAIAASNLKPDMVVNLSMMPGIKHTIKTAVDKGKFIEITFTDKTGTPRSTTLNRNELVSAY